jgi:hypothetical protein
MRTLRSLCFGALSSAALSLAAWGQAPDQSLELHAVTLVSGPKDGWAGNGVYLGSGLILTAAHVAGAPGSAVKLQIGGRDLAGRVVRQGQFPELDLALISLDDGQLSVSLRLRRMTICKRPPSPGENVIVAIPGAIARSHVISPSLLPRKLAAKFQTAISDVATTGNSGSGVFDANEKCLLGIISAKIWVSELRRENGQTVKERFDIAKYFVPSPVITAFIPPQYRF